MTGGLLPDEVRWRVGKEHVGRRYIEALMEALESSQPADVSEFFRNETDGQDTPPSVNTRLGQETLAAWFTRLGSVVE